jgi:hypothetical protein
MFSGKRALLSLVLYLKSIDVHRRGKFIEFIQAAEFMPVRCINQFPSMNLTKGAEENYNKDSLEEVKYFNSAY